MKAFPLSRMTSKSFFLSLFLPPGAVTYTEKRVKAVSEIIKFVIDAASFENCPTLERFFEENDQTRLLKQT